jgi:Ribbon-helix-helix protein, copG family
MAIAKISKRHHQTAASEREAEAFISSAGQHGTAKDRDANKKPTMIRVAPDLLERIDRGAKRLGISRSAFIVSSAAEKLERMESGG